MIKIQSYVNGEWRTRNRLNGLNMASISQEQKLLQAALIMIDWQQNYGDGSAILRVTIQ